MHGEGEPESGGAPRTRQAASIDSGKGGRGVTQANRQRLPLKNPPPSQRHAQPSPVQHLQYKQNACAHAPHASLFIPLHPTASHCIPLHPYASHCIPLQAHRRTRTRAALWLVCSCSSAPWASRS